eukprot:gene16170-4908_t
MFSRINCSWEAEEEDIGETERRRERMLKRDLDDFSPKNFYEAVSDADLTTVYRCLKHNSALANCVVRAG